MHRLRNYSFRHLIILGAAPRCVAGMFRARWTLGAYGTGRYAATLHMPSADLRAVLASYVSCQYLNGRDAQPGDAQIVRLYDLIRR